MSSFRAFARPFFNQIKKLSKIKWIESFLASKTQGKGWSDFWSRLLPPVESYKRGSFREVERKGIKYRLDISDYLEYVIYFGLNVESKDQLYKVVKNGMTVFDVGTNNGETLLNFAHLNPNGMNYGFEPVPFLFKKATDNISLNDFKNISLNNLALSDQEGSLFFEIPKNRNFGSINMVKHAVPGAMEVRAIQLDSFVREKSIRKVDLIKIDVEGFEANVLKASIETIRRDKPILFIEVVDRYLHRAGSSAADLIDMILGFGYTIKDANTLENITVACLKPDSHIDIICENNAKV